MRDMGIPVYDCYNEPGWLNRNDAPESNYQALWIYPGSPSTPYVAPNGDSPKRHLLLDPRYKDVQGNVGQDEWWIIIERLWDVPEKFDPNNHGKWGRLVNFHNCPGDAGSKETGTGGVGWGFGAGSSALALDWNKTLGAPSLSVLTAYRSEGGFDVPLPWLDNVYNTYVFRWVAGRTDGTTVRPGELDGWANGKQVVSKRNLNTVQKAQFNGTGPFYVQRWMTMWEGDYTSALPVEAIHRLVLTRLGKTYDEAYNDVPVAKKLLTEEGGYYRVSGTAPAPKFVRITPDRDKKSGKYPDFGTPVPPPVPRTFTSNIVTGSEVEQGSNWIVSVTPECDRLEMWMDGTRIADIKNADGTKLTTGSVALESPVGDHAIGIQAWYGEERYGFGTGGVVATFKITPKTEIPPDPTVDELKGRIVQLEGELSTANTTIAAKDAKIASGLKEAAETVDALD